jgi:hypothetical protein
MKNCRYSLSHFPVTLVQTVSCFLWRLVVSEKPCPARSDPADAYSTSTTNLVSPLSTLPIRSRTPMTSSSGSCVCSRASATVRDVFSKYRIAGTISHVAAGAAETEVERALESSGGQARKELGKCLDGGAQSTCTLQVLCPHHVMRMCVSPSVAPVASEHRTRPRCRSCSSVVRRSV